MLLLMLLLLLMTMLLMLLLQDATLALAAAIHCGETSKMGMSEFARRVGIDKDDVAYKNWFGTAGAAHKGGLYELVGGRGDAATYKLTAVGKKALLGAFKADAVRTSRMPRRARLTRMLCMHACRHWRPS